METKNIVLYILLGVTVITALAVLIAALGWVENPDPKLISLGIPSILVEITATTLIILKGEWGSQVGVNLTFKDTDFLDLEFIPKNCHYKICSSTGADISTGNIHPTLGHGGWAVSIPSSIKSDQSVSLTLKTTCGQSWKVRPFLPLVHTQNVAKV